MFVRPNNIVQIINIDFSGGTFESGQNAMFIKDLFTFQFLACMFYLFDTTALSGCLWLVHTGSSLQQRLCKTFISP